MTLELESGTEVKSLPVMMPGGEEAVIFGGVEVPTREFLQAALYVLTNTEVFEGDPKMRFVNLVREMELGASMNPGRKVLVLKGDQAKAGFGYSFIASRRL